MRIVVTGGKGMLGRTLQRRWSGHEVSVVDLPEVDVTEGAGTLAALEAARAEVVVHCAAMTAVDRCEGERELAYRVNAQGTANVAAACQRLGARLVAISTDYVFDGTLDRPYHEGDAPAPRSVYGASKLAGEEAVRAGCADHCIVRIAWLYGPGGPSFLHTILRLARQPGAPLKVVDDQVGNPTSTDAVAERLLDLVTAGARGTFHLTCEGETSWYGFARAVLRGAGIDRAVVPCTTADFPRPAPRPANSRLEKRALREQGFAAMPTWEEALARFLRDYPEEWR